MTDTPSQRSPVASLEEIEQRLQVQLDETLMMIERHELVDAMTVAAMGTLAAAMQNVHRVRATPLAAAPIAPFDVGALCGRVWNAVQDAGAPTSASDAAVDAIREIVGGEA